VNIEKVNAILSKALVQIQEGEAQSLRELVLSEADTDDEPTRFEAVVSLLADKVQEAAEVDDGEAIDAIIEAAGLMADQGEIPELFGLDSPTEEDVEAWIEAVEGSSLVENALQSIAA
jgi:hypothetical protein